MLKVNTEIKSVAGGANYEITGVSENKVTLLRENGNPDDTLFSKVIEFYADKKWEQSVNDNDSRRAAALAKYIYENISTVQQDITQSEQFKLIQFHSSYSYEDFVRGIVAKPNEEGEGVLYKAENKLLGEFAKEALQNYVASSNTSTIDSKEIVFKNKLNSFIDKVQTDIDNNGEFIIGDDTTAKIVAVVSDGFIYSFDKRKDIKYKLSYSDLIKIFNSPKPIEKTIDVRDIAKGYLEMIGKHPYYFKVFKLIELIDVKAQVEKQVAAKKYVLIIDEINRANLSSVLGELIYALEYRGEAVESMYTIEGDNKLTLPPNLYIIGTMNTADRSVGNIDYAIRRRFAFVDVLSEDLSNSLGDKFNKVLFDKVTALFNHDTYLSKEFEVKDVQLGHSYFIDKTEDGATMQMRLDYEIKPILREYLKDGVLIGEGIKKTIEDLSI